MTSEPTEADHALAKSLIAHAHSGWCAAYPGQHMPNDCHCRLQGISDSIAAHLADERDKARAPFLAILEEEPNVQPLWELERGILRGIDMCKAAIRRAAQESS